MNSLASDTDTELHDLVAKGKERHLMCTAVQPEFVRRTSPGNDILVVIVRWSREHDLLPEHQRISILGSLPKTSL